MPGPAGGSGGGGFGGGSRGSGSGGGNRGYGGGYGRRHHHYGGFFFFPWRRPYYGYGGGFFGGLFGLFFLPIIILVLAGTFLVSSIVVLISAIASGGIVQYDERAFGDYAQAQYDAIYPQAVYGETYEDNILIVFTTTEDLDGYYTIVWAGDNISDNINRIFAEDSEYGTAIDNNINVKDYKYSLDKNLAMVINHMATKSAGYNSFIIDSGSPRAPSQVINRDEDLQFTADTVQNALNNFTDKTGIPISIVIEDEEDVFGRKVPVAYIVSGVISLGICTFAGVWIYKSIKAKKRAKREEANRRSGTDYNDPRYWN